MRIRTDHVIVVTIEGVEPSGELFAHFEGVARLAPNLPIPVKMPDGTVQQIRLYQLDFSRASLHHLNPGR